MPRISIEGAIGIAMGVLLLILDKRGIGGTTVYIALFSLAAILCFDSIVRSEWATSDPVKQPPRQWGGGAIVCTTFLILGLWIFLPKRGESDAKKRQENVSDKNQPIVAPPKAEPSQPVQQAKPPKNTHEKPTLLGLFNKDLTSPGMASFTDKGFDLTGSDGQTIHVNWRLVVDFASKSEFIAFYLPLVKDDVAACVTLADYVHPIINGLSQHMDAAGGNPGEITSLRDLTFSGRVFIYLEWPLTNKQKADIIEAYSAKGMDVQFRGLDFLNSRILEWERKHGKQPTNTPATTRGPSSPKPQQDNSVHIGEGAKVDQSSTGPCSPNMIGGSNTVNCAAPVRTVADKLAKDLRMPNSEAPIVDIWLAEVNSESKSYGSQLADAFQRATWFPNYDPNTQSFLSISGADLSAPMNCIGSMADSYVQRAYSAFHNSGIQCNWVDAPAMHNGRGIALKILIRPRL